jgi:hypothetical protein
MNSATRRFRERSAHRLHKIGLLLDQWLDDWEEYPFEALSPPEYPFDQSLDEVISRLHHAVELLGREECDECGELTDDYAAGPSNQHAYSCSLYEPKHRAHEEFSMTIDPPSSDGVHVMSARPCMHLDGGEPYHNCSTGTKAVEIARQHFRRMVTAFEGDYHPDRLYYRQDYPKRYSQERVMEVEEIARALGLDLYAEALAVTREALSP